MPDIISAKCFGCGHVVKVPPALGGKKAKCPKCANVITIPRPSAFEPDFISDEQLPEVARDEDLIEEGILLDEEAAVLRANDSAERTPRSTRSMTPRQGTPAPRGGTRVRTGYSPPKKKSSAGVWIAVCVAAAAIVIIVVLAAGPKGQAKAPDPKGAAAEKAPVEAGPIDPELRERCEVYLAAFRRGNLIDIMAFYAFEPADERAVRSGISALLENEVAYKEAYVSAARVQGETGTTTISCDYGSKGQTPASREITFNWRKVNGVWLIADKP